MNLDRVIAVRTGKIVYRDGEDCVKVFEREYAAADVFREAQNQASAESAGLCVPKLRSVMMLDGKWSIVSEYIRGKTLEERIAREPEKRKEHLQLLVDLQCEMYACPTPPLHRQKDILRREIGFAAVSDPVRKALLLRLARSSDEECLCHGDLNPSNIILTWGGIPYIVDWLHASLGSPATDAARSYLHFFLSGDEGAGADYLALFCRKNHISEKEIRFRLPIVAAALSLCENLDKREKLLALVRTEMEEPILN